MNYTSVIEKQIEALQEAQKVCENPEHKCQLALSIAELCETLSAHSQPENN